MDNAAVAAVCIGAVVLVVALLVAAGVARRRREERWRFEVRGWAKHNGWRVTFEPQVDWGARLPGRNHRGATMALTGTVNGRRVDVGNYTYTTTSTSTSVDGNGQTTMSTTTHAHHLTVVAVHVQGQLPSMTLHTRGAISKLGRRIFGDSPAATGHAEFDRRFRIESVHPDAARALFGPALTAEYLAGRLPLWNLHNGTLLTYQQGRVHDPSIAPALAVPLLRVAELLGR